MASKICAAEITSCNSIFTLCWDPQKFALKLRDVQKKLRAVKNDQNRPGRLQSSVPQLFDLDRKPTTVAICLIAKSKGHLESTRESVHKQLYLSNKNPIFVINPQIAIVINNSNNVVK